MKCMPPHMLLEQGFRTTRHTRQLAMDALVVKTGNDEKKKIISENYIIGDAHGTLVRVAKKPTVVSTASSGADRELTTTTCVQFFFRETNCFTSFFKREVLGSLTFF